MDFARVFFPHIKHIDFELTEYEFVDSQVPLKKQVFLNDLIFIILGNISLK